MKKRKLSKIITFILIMLCILVLNNNIIYASSLSNAVEGAQGFIDAGVEDESPAISDETLQNMSNSLYNAILVVATIIAIIVGLFIGLKFITGSISEKVEVKKMLIPYIAGCIVIFGAFGIWKIVVNILSQAA